MTALHAPDSWGIAFLWKCGSFLWGNLDTTVKKDFADGRESLINPLRSVILPPYRKKLLARLLLEGVFE